MPKTAQQRLFERWTTLSRRREQRLEPWLERLLSKALERWSEPELALAIDGALKAAHWTERQRLTLPTILKDSTAIKGWMLAGEATRGSPQPPKKALAEGSPTASQPGTRIELSVPWADKDEAKKHGARWDPQQRTWYAPVEGCNLDAIQRWVKHTHLLNHTGKPTPTETQEEMFRRKAAENAREIAADRGTGTELEPELARQQIAHLRAILRNRTT